MSKKIIIATIIAAIGLGVAGYLYWNYFSKTSAEKAADLMDDALNAATQGVLPEINPSADALGENIQDVNPINKINPFKGVYTNPFE